MPSANTWQPNSSNVPCTPDQSGAEGILETDLALSLVDEEADVRDQVPEHVSKLGCFCCKVGADAAQMDSCVCLLQCR